MLRYQRSIGVGQLTEGKMITALQEPLNKLKDKLTIPIYKKQPLDISIQLKTIKNNVKNLNLDVIKNILLHFDKYIDTNYEFWNETHRPIVDELKQELRQILIKTIFFDTLMDILEKMKNDISNRDTFIDNLSIIYFKNLGVDIDDDQLTKVKNIKTIINNGNNISPKYIDEYIQTIFKDLTTPLRDKLLPKPLLSNKSKKGGQKKTKKNKKTQINPVKTRKK